MAYFLYRGGPEDGSKLGGDGSKMVRVGIENTTRIKTLGLLAGSCFQVNQVLKRWSVSTIAQLRHEVALSLATVTAALCRLGETGLVTELIGRQRNRFFAIPIIWRYSPKGPEFDFRWCKAYYFLFRKQNCPQTPCTKLSAGV